MNITVITDHIQRNNLRCSVTVIFVRCWIVLANNCSIFFRTNGAITHKCCHISYRPGFLKLVRHFLYWGHISSIMRVKCMNCTKNWWTIQLGVVNKVRICLTFLSLWDHCKEIAKGDGSAADFIGTIKCTDIALTRQKVTSPTLLEELLHKLRKANIGGL